MGVDPFCGGGPLDAEEPVFPMGEHGHWPRRLPGISTVAMARILVFSSTKLFLSSPHKGRVNMK